MDSAETAKYQGRCHCGLFRFTLNVAPLTTLWTCSCSICSKNGYLWIHPVEESQLTIDLGKEKDLHAYHYAMRGTTHLFCPECGSSVMARRRDALPNQSLRINARMLDDIDLNNFTIKPFSNSNHSSKRNSRDDSQLKSSRTNSASSANGERKAQAYDGNCHCGNFKFRLKLPELKTASKCHCSICNLKGGIWIAPLVKSQFTISTKPGPTVSTYEFGEHKMTHHFCSNCGSAAMVTRFDDSGTKVFVFNARLLKNPPELTVDTFPGISLESSYIPPASFPSLALTSLDIEAGLVKYQGACHCGGVTYAVKTRPLEEIKVMQCNCSLCSRNADLFIYPPASAVALSKVSRANLTGYPFLSLKSLHSFCKVCGVSMVRQVSEEPKDDEELDMPINVRTIKDADVGKLKRRFYDCAKNKPLYEV